MTGTKKLEPVVPIVAKPASAEQEIIPTPAQMMTEDGFAKKEGNLPSASQAFQLLR